MLPRFRERQKEKDKEQRQRLADLEASVQVLPTALLAPPSPSSSAQLRRWVRKVPQAFSENEGLHSRAWRAKTRHRCTYMPCAPHMPSSESLLRALQGPGREAALMQQPRYHVLLVGGFMMCPLEQAKLGPEDVRLWRPTMLASGQVCMVCRSGA